MKEYQVRWMILDSDESECGSGFWRPAVAAEVREGSAVLSVYRRKDKYWMWVGDFRTEASMRKLFGSEVTIDPIDD